MTKERRERLKVKIADEKRKGTATFGDYAMLDLIADIEAAEARVVAAEKEAVVRRERKIECENLNKLLDAADKREAVLLKCVEAYADEGNWSLPHEDATDYCVFECDGVTDGDEPTKAALAKVKELKENEKQ